MNNAILVGTYHKTGSLWLRSVFMALADMLDVPIYNISPNKFQLLNNYLLQRTARNQDRCIIFDSHCRYEPKYIDPKWFKGIRMIRDPRDILISGTKYHKWAKETWLHEPREKFGGMTYQQMLNSISDFDDQLIFEMKNALQDTIKCILKFNVNELFTTVKYEDLITDYSLKLWRKITLHLGLTEDELPCADEAFLENTLFSNKDLANDKHIQSGKIQQYKEVFSERITAEFDRMFPEAVSKMGY